MEARRVHTYLICVAERVAHRDVEEHAACV